MNSELSGEICDHDVFGLYDGCATDPTSQNNSFLVVVIHSEPPEGRIEAPPLIRSLLGP